MPPEDEKYKNSEATPSIEAERDKTSNALAGVKDSVEHLMEGRFSEFVESLEELNLEHLFGKFMTDIKKLMSGDWSVISEWTKGVAIPELGADSESNEIENNETEVKHEGATLESLGAEKVVLVGASNFASNWMEGVGHGSNEIGTTKLSSRFPETSIGGKNAAQIFSILGLSLNKDTAKNDQFVDDLKGKESMLIMLANNESHPQDPMPEMTPENLEKYKKTKQYRYTARMASFAKRAGVKPVICTPVAFSYTKYASKDLPGKLEWHKRVAYFTKLAWPDQYIDFYKDGKLSPKQEQIKANNEVKTNGKAGDLHPGGAYLSSIIREHVRPNKSKPSEGHETNLVHTPYNVVYFGDSLAEGPGIGNKRNLGISAQSSKAIRGRLDQLEAAKESGATAVFVSVGANDGVPNRNNVLAVLDRAIELFGAKNVIMATVPKYNKLDHYKKYAASIKKHNNWLAEYSKEKGFKLYKYETGGHLHPSKKIGGYVKVRKDITNMLGVKNNDTANS